MTDKSCAITAMSDGLETMKTHLYYATLKQGLSKKTHVIGLADGAHNLIALIAEPLHYVKYCNDFAVIVACWIDSLRESRYIGTAYPGKTN
jgi:hypothetical protein